MKPKPRLVLPQVAPVIRTTRTWNVLHKSFKSIFLNFYWCQAPTRHRKFFADTQLKRRQVVTALLVEQCLNNTVTQLSWLNNVVQRRMLFIVSTMLFSINEAKMVVAVVETGENNIDRTSLFAIVIIFCLMFESGCLFVGWLPMVAVTYLSRQFCRRIIFLSLRRNFFLRFLDRTFSFNDIL